MRALRVRVCVHARTRSHAHMCLCGRSAHTTRRPVASVHRKRAGALNSAELQQDCTLLEDIWLKEDELDHFRMRYTRASTYVILAIFEDCPMSCLNLMYIRGLFLSTRPRPTGPALNTIFLSAGISLILFGYKIAHLGRLTMLMNRTSNLTQELDAAIKEAVSGTPGSTVTSAATAAIRRFRKVVYTPMADAVNRLGSQRSISARFLARSTSCREQAATEPDEVVPCNASPQREQTRKRSVAQLEDGPPSLIDTRDAVNSGYIGYAILDGTNRGEMHGDINPGLNSSPIPSDIAEGMGTPDCAHSNSQEPMGGVEGGHQQQPPSGKGSFGEQAGSEMAAVDVMGPSSLRASQRGDLKSQGGDLKPKRPPIPAHAPIASPALPSPDCTDSIGGATYPGINRLQLPWVGAFDTTGSTHVSLTWDVSHQVASILLSSPSSDVNGPSDLHSHEPWCGLRKRRRFAQQQELHVSPNRKPASPISPGLQARPVRPQYLELARSVSTTAAVVSAAISRAAQRESKRQLRAIDELVGLAWAAFDRAEVLTFAAEQRVELAQQFADARDGPAQLRVTWDEQGGKALLALSNGILREGADHSMLPDSPKDAELQLGWI